MSTLKLDFASQMMHLNFWRQWDISLIISVLNTHNIITYIFKNLLIEIQMPVVLSPTQSNQEKQTHELTVSIRMNKSSGRLDLSTPLL